MWYSQDLSALLAAPSVWQAQMACRRVYAGPLPLESDLVVIGAGLSGLAAAQRALDAGLSVTVLEATEVGGGASGRNSGFVVPLPSRHTPHSLRHLLGDGAAPFLAALQCAATQVLALARPINRAQGWIQPLAHGGPGDADTLAKGWKSLGVDVSALGQDELAATLGTQGYTSGLYHPGGGALDPLGLVQQLANAVYQRGGLILERCTVDRITPASGHVALDTPAGRIKAGRVVIAGNAYGTGASRMTRRAVGQIPLALATFSSPTLAGASAMPFSDTHKDMWFARRLDSHTLLTGCFALPWQGSAGRCAQLLQDRIERLYGYRPPAPQHQWAGWVGLTANGLPSVHHDDPRIIGWSGCNGRGIALSVLMGQRLVERLYGMAGERLPLPGKVGWRPSSPWAWLVQTVIAYDRRKQQRLIGAT